MPRPSSTPQSPDTPTKPLRAALVLADGTTFLGVCFGTPGSVFGEVVFNTAMTGYQEVLTDPSYTGQIVTLTHPHIGNTGIQARDSESSRPRLAGLIISEETHIPSHPHSVMSLDAYLKDHGIMGVAQIDTRALVRHIRSQGAQAAMLTTNIPQTGPWKIEPEVAAELAHSVTSWDEHRQHALAMLASTPRPYTIQPSEHQSVRGENRLIVAYDFGIKRAILEQLTALGCKVVVVPANFPADAVLRMNPDGVFLSNGPGDPRQLEGPIQSVTQMLGKVPMFGICLGHQILALAMGASVEKLPFGHRGANHPVLDRATGRIEITSQNHGYHVISESLPDDITVTHVNLNDHTLEGIAHNTLPVFSVQYHPEASPGPHDAHHHFLRFIDLIHRSTPSCHADKTSNVSV